MPRDGALAGYAAPVAVVGADLATLDLHHHDVLDALRQQGAVVWLDALGGWVVLTREVAVAVMRDAATFTVDDPRFTTARVVGPSMLSLDGAEHRRHRDPFVAALRSSEVAQVDAQSIANHATRALGEVVPKGEGELRREFAGPLAVAVAAGALGLADHRAEVLLGWYDLIVAGVDSASRGDPIGERAREAVASLGAAVRESSTKPGSLLAAVSAELSADELVSNAAVFLFGGIETAEGMTANVLHHLLANRDQMDLVRADRSLIDDAVEESLRLEPAAARVDRYATRNLVLAGQSIVAGDLVVVSLAAANRDPAQYLHPHRYIVGREGARSHVAFAHGPHSCIGATLARLQSRAAIAAVLDLLPDVRLAGEVQTTGIVFRKPVALNCRWTVPAELL